MTTKHTPTPWRLELEEDGVYTIHGNEPDKIFSWIANNETYYPSAPSLEDATFIVRACNERQMLIDALEIAYEAFSKGKFDKFGRYRPTKAEGEAVWFAVSQALAKAAKE